MDLLQIFNSPSTPPGINAFRLVQVTAPAVEPWLVTDAEVTQALKLDSSADTNYVTLVLKSARRYLEQLTGRSLITTVWRAEWDYLPRAGTYAGAPTIRSLALPVAPLISVASVKYLDTDGAEQTFSSANYTVETGLDLNKCGRLWLNDTADWPDLGSFPGALRVQFTAGHGPAATDVPEQIRLAMLFLAAHWYESRLPANPDGAVELPHHLSSLIDLARVNFTP